MRKDNVMDRHDRSTTFHGESHTDDSVAHQVAITGVGLWRLVDTDNFFGPASAAAAHTTGDYNVIGGVDAGAALTTADYEAIYGYKAAENLIYGEYDVFVGAGAANGATNSGGENVGIGRNVLNSMAATGGNTKYNVAICSEAARNLTIGFGGIYIGRQAGYFITESDYNTVAGYIAFPGDSGSLSEYNSVFGALGLGNTDDSSNNSVFGAGGMEGIASNKLSGQRNSSFGYYAGRYIAGNSNRNLYLGENAGPQSETTEDDQLYIGNSVNPSFITGDMSASPGTLTLDANTTISGTLTVNGDQTGATDHVFDDYDDMELLTKWRRGEELPFNVGDILNRDRLLRDAIIQLEARLRIVERG